MSKRGQNEGSIFKQKDSTWRAYMNLGYQGGTRKRKYFYGKTRKEAQEKLTAALRNRQLGLPVSNDKITFGQFLDSWLDESVKPSVRASTLDRYTRDVRIHIKPDLGKKSLSKLTIQDIQALINKKQKAGCSPNTIRHFHAVIRKALNVACKWELVSRNVATLVDRPRIPHFEIQPLSPEQARAFLKAIKGDRLEAFYTVAVALGLRRGEVLALQWQDIDFEVEELRVRHTLQILRGGGWNLAEPKSRNSRRTLHLPKFAVQVLRDHRQRQLKERMIQGSHWQDSGFVFTSEIGTPLDGNNVYKLYKQLLKDNDLPDIRFHDLRHTAGTLLLVQGVHLRVAMETLGHSQISLTMNTYSHVSSELQRDAAEKMDAILSGRN